MHIRTHTFSEWRKGFEVEIKVTILDPRIEMNDDDLRLASNTTKELTDALAVIKTDDVQT